MSIDTGTPTWLRTYNDRAAFRLLLEHGPLSRSMLGKLSGMSKPTAGQMITRLERLGLISPVGEVTGARGPKATAYGARADSMTGVAVSILADRIEAVLVDPTDAGHPIADLSIEGVERSPVTDVTRAVDAACATAGVDRASVSVVAVGVQAAVDADTDRLTFTDTLPGWPERGARALIEAGTGLTTTVENDVNLAAMAERAITDEADFVFLWLGSGLGTGINVDGVVRRGASGSAGEIGYLEVPRSAIALDPAAETFTDLLGGPAIARLLGHPSADFTAALKELPQNEPVLAELAVRVVMLVDVITAVLDPACVVLGGPTGLAGGDRLAELVQARVRASRAGDEPVLQGARQLLVANIRERLEAAIAASRFHPPSSRDSPTVIPAKAGIAKGES